MGRETKTFRQTRRSGTADHANKSYARINRSGGWGKIFNAFKLKRGEIK